MKVQYRGSKYTSMPLKMDHFNQFDNRLYVRQIYQPFKARSGSHQIDLNDNCNNFNKSDLINFSNNNNNNKSSNNNNNNTESKSRQNNVRSWRITIEDGILTELVSRMNDQRHRCSNYMFFKQLIEMPDKMSNMTYEDHEREVKVYIKNMHKKYCEKKQKRNNNTNKKIKPLPLGMLELLSDTLIRFRYMTVFVVIANLGLIKSLLFQNKISLIGKLKQTTVEIIDKYDIFVAKYRQRVSFDIVYNVVKCRQSQKQKMCNDCEFCQDTENNNCSVIKDVVVLGSVFCENVINNMNNSSNFLSMPGLIDD